MLKPENRIWFYLIGLAALMALFIYIGLNYFFPWIKGKWDLSRITLAFQQPPEFTIDVNKDYRARVNTNLGSFEIDLLEKAAPENVNNFAFLANKNYYDGTEFFRLVPGLLVQGGDRNTLDSDKSNDGFGSPGYLIKDEVNWDALKLSTQKRAALSAAGYKSASNLKSHALGRFTVAMANNGPNTNGAQFFILFASADDNRVRDMEGKFTVIGTISAGGEVVNKIEALKVTDVNSNVPRPKTKLLINSVSIFTAS